MRSAARRGIGAGAGEQTEGEESQRGDGGLEVAFHGMFWFGVRSDSRLLQRWEHSHAGDPSDVHKLALAAGFPLRIQPAKVCIFLDGWIVVKFFPKGFRSCRTSTE